MFINSNNTNSKKIVIYRYLNVIICNKKGLQLFFEKKNPSRKKKKLLKKKKKKVDIKNVVILTYQN